jgi:hypothetical protein
MDGRQNLGNGTIVIDRYPKDDGYETGKIITFFLLRYSHIKTPAQSGLVY